MHPFLMEQSVNHDVREHVVSITIDGSASTSECYGAENNDSDESSYEVGPPANVQAPTIESSSRSSLASDSRNASSSGDDNQGHQHRSPLNSGLWISMEFIVNLSQIIAAIVVLSLSRNEDPQTPLFAWAVGYTAGCVATLPHLYWRYMIYYAQGLEQDSAQSVQSSETMPTRSTSYTIISINDVLEGEHLRGNAAVLRFGRNFVIASPRLNAFVDHFKMVLDCFFAVWFVVGNVWVFGGRSSAAHSPNLYRLCIALLTFSCIGYAMPFIFCATICCCLPCVFTVLGLREDSSQSQGATTNMLRVLPTYKFNSKGSQNGEESGTSLQGQGGILGAGTNKERIISAEDCVCCICLVTYMDNDDLRELPCLHFFHKECVDKWLKLTALCPLCKSVIR